MQIIRLIKWKTFLSEKRKKVWHCTTPPFMFTSKLQLLRFISAIKGFRWSSLCTTIRRCRMVWGDTEHYNVRFYLFCSLVVFGLICTHIAISNIEYITAIEEQQNQPPLWSLDWAGGGGRGGEEDSRRFVVAQLQYVATLNHAVLRRGCMRNECPHVSQTEPQFCPMISKCCDRECVLAILKGESEMKFDFRAPALNIIENLCSTLSWTVFQTAFCKQYQYVSELIKNALTKAQWNVLDQNAIQNVYEYLRSWLFLLWEGTTKYVQAPPTRAGLSGWSSGRIIIINAE